MIPDVEKCFQLMDEYAMLPNIRRHSVIVARAALEVFDGYRASSAPGMEFPDRKLIIAGALLHDIAKTPCLKDNCDHARAGAEICNELGYPDIAPIVAHHVVLKDYDPKRYRQGIFTATEIIYYADKRVRHEEIVSLADRLEYILEHYGMEDPVMHGLIRKNFNKCVQLEEHLFSFIHFSPDQLAEKVIENMAGRQETAIPGEERIFV
jgi:putative nucleotidyltransferase with HDIG domain